MILLLLWKTNGRTFKKKKKNKEFWVLNKGGGEMGGEEEKEILRSADNLNDRNNFWDIFNKIF